MNDAKRQGLTEPQNWLDLYGDQLYRYAFARVQNRMIAEDLVQETFLAALRAPKNFKGRSAGRTGLTAILKHKIVDHIRKKIRKPSTDKMEILTDASDPDFDEHGHWQIRPGQWAINPDHLYEQKEFVDVLYHCLAELPERLAEAFIKREMDGLSTAEICKELGITASNSWVMLYRARMSLRRCLDNRWFSAGS